MAKADSWLAQNALPDFRANTIELSKILFELSGIQPMTRDHREHSESASTLQPITKGTSLTASYES